MQDEDFLRRPAAPQPYSLTPAILYLSSDAVHATHKLLQRAGRNESCVFWYGERHGDNASVHSIRAPVQRSRRGNYHVEPESMSEMVRDLRAAWRPLAQIHSHPGVEVEHSRYDDAMVSSRRILSIVFPYYGRPIANWPSDIGVHEWQLNYWHMLSSADAMARVRLREFADVEVRDFR
ncbi:hypothetical protein EFD56_27980 [Rhizobium phaseoli]|uniref:Mov34/MPN/PAD-1 family protein n=1 Tax=Rhizobium phaseoli TaxID=396 RepID=UPI000F86C218|nr:Mov34/MPN/PAD-1 family protein [Rhizobium phaseoli]RUM13496.1 hypothetical protein EFD56_27980 [Rhizobium phaseoli]